MEEALPLWSHALLLPRSTPADRGGQCQEGPPDAPTIVGLHVTHWHRAQPAAGDETPDDVPILF